MKVGADFLVESFVAESGAATNRLRPPPDKFFSFSSTAGIY